MGMQKQALLLLNMGGPNTIEEVELFLRNMFADKNILTMNPLYAVNLLPTSLSLNVWKM